jgi:hypothetical protein
MNRQFTSTSAPARSVFALAAIVATVLVLGSIDGLATLYSSGGQLAAATSEAARA